MKNLLKLFEGSDTGLKNNLVHHTHRRLTLMYSCAILVILTMGIFRFIRYQRLRVIETKALDDFMHPQTAGVTPQEQFILNGLHHEEVAVLAFNIVFTVGSIVFFYFLGSLPLKPLNENMERQKRFIHDASHELMTPLSNMKINQEVLLMNVNNLTKEEAMEVVRNNLLEVNRLTEIIKNLLAFSDTQREDMPMAMVNIMDSIHGVIKLLKISAEQKGVNVRVMPSEEIMINGNRIALEQMIVNILKNAIAHTPRGGTIDIFAQRKSEKKLSIVIQDTGIGIAPNDLPHIFLPFYKADESRKHAGDGSYGLGLTLTQYIVKKHGGKIQISSQVNEGTIVEVLLPI